MNKRIYEVHSTLFTCKEELLAKAIRKKAFLEGIENPTKEQLNIAKEEQVKFIEALRENMEDGKVLESVKEYKNKRTTLIPSPVSVCSFLIIFFDMDTNETAVKCEVAFDENKEKFYMEITEEENK